MSMQGSDVTHLNSLEKGGAIKPPHNRTPVHVYDFFAGCGGTSAGLQRAGMTPIVAIDFDKEASATYAENFPAAKAICEDVRYLRPADLAVHFEKVRQVPVLFSACAPCQPFSRQNRQKRDDDGRLTLLSELHSFIVVFRPELLLIENVPGLQDASEGAEGPLPDLLKLLDQLGYSYSKGVLQAQDYGVPQSRRRLIVVASLFGPISLPDPTHGPGLLPYRTVRDAIGSYPPIGAGEQHAVLANHRASMLSDANLARIRATGEGRGWKTWEQGLRLDCHRSVKGFSDVYGRMAWDRPAPALTTRCISLSNGRFGHPDQDRAISIREAATLQTFDETFSFTGSINGMARQIGNAVPVEMARVVGQALMDHVFKYIEAFHGEA
jgi:DNA (cytosine-5)-methyltransferase 1